MVQCVYLQDERLPEDADPSPFPCRLKLESGESAPIARIRIQVPSRCFIGGNREKLTKTSSVEKASSCTDKVHGCIK
jgi:hypothetical protein